MLRVVGSFAFLGVAKLWRWHQNQSLSCIYVRSDSHPISRDLVTSSLMSSNDVQKRSGPTSSVCFPEGSFVITMVFIARQGGRKDAAKPLLIGGAVLLLFLMVSMFSGNDYTGEIDPSTIDQDIKKNSLVYGEGLIKAKDIDLPPGGKMLRIFHHAPARGQGKSGMMIHDQLLCHAYAFAEGAQYGGACGEAEYDEHIALLNAIGLRDEIPFACPSDYEPDERYRYSMIQRLKYEQEDSRIWTPEYIDFLKSKVVYPEKKTDKFTIVVHVKRGKTLTPCKKERKGYKTYLPNSHYQRLIDKYMQPGAQVKIFSEEDSFESFDEFKKKGYELHLSHQTEEVWQEILMADVVILSRSSFGLLPSLVSKGTVVYTPFWHKPIFGWKVVTDEDILKALDMDTKALMPQCTKAAAPAKAKPGT